MTMIARGEMPYQEGSIVSRVLMKAEGGQVTLFTMDEGQAIEPHTSPTQAMLHVVEGNLSVTVGEEQHDAGQGDTVLFPPNIPHGLTARTRARCLVIMLKRGDG